MRKGNAISQVPEVRPCAYRNAGLVGPWRFMHCCQHRLRPKDHFALREPMCGISAQFLSMYQSVRLYGTISTIFFQLRAMCRIPAQFLSTLNPFAFMGKRIDYFFGPELERNRINGDQIFCTRDRAREEFSLSSIGSLKQFLERHHARATSELTGWRSSFRFFVCFCFAWFCTTLKYVPYCFFPSCTNHYT